MKRSFIFLSIFVLIGYSVPVSSQLFLSGKEFADSIVTYTLTEEQLVDSIIINDSLANYFDQVGNHQLALEYAGKNVAINSINGKNTIPYAVSILKLARYVYPTEREYDKQLSCEGLSILKDSLGTKSSTFTKYLLEFAWRQYKYNLIQEACDILKDAAEENYNGDEFYLGYLYYSYAHFLEGAERSEEARRYAKKAESFFNEKRMWSDDYYALTLIDLALLSSPNVEESISYLTKAKNVTELYKGKESIDYLNVILDFSNFYKSIGQLDDALDYAQQAKAIGEKLNETDYSSYLYTIEYISNIYSLKQQYDKAIVYAEKCLSLMKERKEISIEDRLPLVDSLITYNWNSSNIEKSNFFAKEAYLIRKSCNNTDEGIIRTLYYLLHSNYYLGNYEECEANVNEVKAIYGEAYSTHYKHYYDDMQLLMHSYFKRDMYKESLEISEELLMNYTNQFGDESEFLANLFKTRASIFSYLRDFEKYHDNTIKYLAIIKDIFGENSPKYLEKLGHEAYYLYLMGFADDSYKMFKDAATIAKRLYGKMNLHFISNYLSATLLWNNSRGELFDDYRIEDLYSFLLFQRIGYLSVNSDEQRKFEDYMNSLYIYLQAALPNLILKYKNDASAFKGIYNCFLLKKIKLPKLEELKLLIQNELEQDKDQDYIDFCNTYRLFIKAETSSAPEYVDSLYGRIIYFMNELSNNSLTFKSFNEGRITVDSIQNSLLENEIVIDYIPLKHLGEGYVDYLVTIDCKNSYPNYIPVTNAAEQIKKICNSYNTHYILNDNDSIISILGIEISRPNCVIGYDLSIDHIINRNAPHQITTKIQIKHIDLFSLAINEFEKGVSLYNKKQYKVAIDAFYQCDSLMSLAKGKNSNYFGHGNQWISNCFHKLGEDSVAQFFSNYYYLQPIDMRQTILSDSIVDVADSLYDIGNKKEAVEKYLEASEVEKKKLGKNSYWYANTISHCAEICNEIGEYEKAIEYETKALKIREKSPGIDHIDYYWSLVNLYNSYIGLGDIKDVINHGEVLIKYMEEHNKIIGWQYNYYTLYTSTIARLMAIDNDSIKALNFCNKALGTIESQIDIPEYYTQSYYDIIFALNKIGQDSLTFELCRKLLLYYESNEDKHLDQDNYSSILISLSNHYYEQGDFITASLYLERAINKAEDKKSLNYGMALSNLSLSYIELNRVEEAIELSKEAINLCDSTDNYGAYADKLINLAACYSKANRPKDALRIIKMCYNLLKDKFGLDNNQTLLAANNLATCYGELGYYDEARNLLLQVIECAEKNYEKNRKVLAAAYNNIAIYYKDSENDLNSSLEYLSKAYEIRKNLLGENNLSTIESLYNKGRCFLELENIPEAVDCIKRALAQTKAIVGEKNLRYIEKIEILPYIYGKAGDLNRALKMSEDRLALLKEVVSENHISYLRALEDLVELYFYTNDTLKLHNTLIETTTNYRKMIISDFPNYTSTERANVVGGMERFFDWLFPLVCYHNQQPEMCSELYNALLLRKGILLNSEIEFGRLIRKSGDSMLISHYNELIANKKMLNRQYQLPVEQRVFDVDSLRHVINEKEDYLVSASKEYGDYTSRFRTNWKDIRDKLKDGELCVEFVEFYDTCAIQNRIYFALVINKNSVSPELVPLCMEQQIHEVMKNNNPGGMYQLIWNPILQKSKNVNTLYFSPAGILNNLGIEYIDINEHENISDKYAIYRLSSTRAIVENQKTACKSAAIYGGLDYSVDVGVLLTQNVRLGIETNSSVMYRGLSDSLAVRNSFEPLYNTKTEISEIDKTLKKGNMVVFMYSDTFGTEESFKALSGKGMNLIHLATHGMYIEASEAESKKRETNLSFIQLDENGGGQIQEEKSLSRSFLVMSGGDMLPSHKEVPDNLEDGILTALEISKLDLRGLDLVVLSACQTALGDIDNEGVYGLQRGFKKAGANTIIMSLDKVDDEATRILMVEFYRNLMNGKTKYQSLRDSQRYLRKVENGKYDDPKYWASFIMLDGLN